MIKSIKVMLKPNNKQETKLFQCAGTARFAYNWALDREQENYKNGGTFDGLNWWISLGVEYPDSTEIPTSDGHRN